MKQTFPKPTFCDLITLYKCDYPQMQQIATQAGVAQDIFNQMVVGKPALHDEAERVLSVMSRESGMNWTLDNVDIPLTKLVPVRDMLKKKGEPDATK
jgi:hypothetical protein